MIVGEPAAVGRPTPCILVAVLGMSPAVITETLWAIHHQERGPMPERIHIVTTARGARMLRAMDGDRRRHLLGDGGMLDRFCDEHGLPRIPCDVTVIRAASGAAVDDIVSAADAADACDTTLSVVHGLVAAHPRHSLHASLAGGRKTMGFDLGYAMTLFGREQDRLTHVLVAPESFECQDFFYPRDERITDRAGTPIDARDATIHLIDRPFLMVHRYLPRDLQVGRGGSGATALRISHREMARAAQARLSAPALRLDARTRTVQYLGHRFTLEPKDFALYWTYAEARRLNVKGCGPDGDTGAAAGEDGGWRDDRGWIRSTDLYLRRKSGAPSNAFTSFRLMYERLVRRDDPQHAQGTVPHARDVVPFTPSAVDAVRAAILSESGKSPAQYFANIRKHCNDSIVAKMKHSRYCGSILISTEQAKGKMGQARHGLAIDPELIGLVDVDGEDPDVGGCSMCPSGGGGA